MRSTLQMTNRTPHWALLVVDVQRDFCSGGALPVKDCERALPAINRYLSEAHERGMTVYASRDWHPAATPHFNTHGGEWPPHCVQESPGAHFHPQLQLPPATIVVTKGDDAASHGYSAFEGHTPSGQSLIADLRERHIHALSVAGLATEYCVKDTTLDARRAGLHVHVLTDAIAGIEREPGDIRRALAEISDAGAHLSTELRPTDVAILSVDWASRAALRAQLIENGFEVLATDTWPAMRQSLRPGHKPQLALVDLKDLPDAEQVLADLEVLMKPGDVLVIAALGTIPAPMLERRGFRVIHRPVTIEEIVSALSGALATEGRGQRTESP
jgi:nicotinamidase/pyrazinamidase